MESTNVTSDRLRKAIERNRAKQARRGPSTIQPDLGIDSPASGWTPRKAAAPRATGSSRRTMSRPEDVEFTTAIRKSPRKAPAPVSYATSRSVVKTTPARRRTPKKKSKLLRGQESLLLKLGWAFAGVLLVRLVFSGGGVIDYYDRKEFIENKYQELTDYKIENELLVGEIDKIQHSARYQRKLVRDHLGFIARDEYLILFHRASVSQSI